MGGIIAKDRSLIPACDVRTLEGLAKIVKETFDVPGIGGYKLGFSLGLSFGLPAACATIREYSDLPIIYDHQKAATDIPKTGTLFAETCKAAGIDAIILFPQAGPDTEKAWIQAGFDAELGVIVGGEMTHPGYTASSGGWLSDDSIEKIYNIAKGEGVRDFVVPGNKPERIAHYAKLLSDCEPVFYSPGLVAQGGEITQSAKAAGKRWHAIVGRGIYEAPDIHKAALDLSKQLL